MATTTRSLNSILFLLLAVCWLFAACGVPAPDPCGLGTSCPGDDAGTAAPADQADPPPVPDLAAACTMPEALNATVWTRCWYPNLGSNHFECRWQVYPRSAGCIYHCAGGFGCMPGTLKISDDGRHLECRVKIGVSQNELVVCDP